MHKVEPWDCDTRRALAKLASSFAAREMLRTRHGLNRRGTTPTDAER